MIPERTFTRFYFDFPFWENIFIHKSKAIQKTHFIYILITSNNKDAGLGKKRNQNKYFCSLSFYFKSQFLSRKPVPETND